MNRLLFSPHVSLGELRENLLASEFERGAILFTQPVATPSSAFRLLVTESVVMQDQSYSRQSPVSLEIPPERLAPLIKRARDTRQSMVLVHTHPWDGEVQPSPQDREGEARLLPVFFARVPTVPHARLILGRRDTHAALFKAPGSEELLTPLDVGPSVNYPPRIHDHVSYDNVFDRQVRAFGAVGQRRLSELRVAIVGLGGTGSIMATQLAHLGVKDFLLIDPDIVETTNLSRIVGTTIADIGQTKVDVAARTIKQIRPDAVITPIKADIVDKSVARSLLSTDFFFGCTDTQGSRAVMTQLAYQYLLPGIDLGVRIEITNGAVSHVVGRVQMLAPGLACTTCTHVLDPEEVRRDLLSPEHRNADPYISGGHIPQPSVVSLNMTIAGLAGSMFLAAVAGVGLRARHQIVLFDAGAVKPIANEPDPKCAICSESGFLGKGDSWPAPGRPDAES